VDEREGKQRACQDSAKNKLSEKPFTPQWVLRPLMGVVFHQIAA
jgi:hypothetical protein